MYKEAKGYIRIDGYKRYSVYRGVYNLLRLEDEKHIGNSVYAVCIVMCIGRCIRMCIDKDII